MNRIFNLLDTAAIGYISYRLTDSTILFTSEPVKEFYGSFETLNDFWECIGEEDRGIIVNFVRNAESAYCFYCHNQAGYLYLHRGVKERDGTCHELIVRHPNQESEISRKRRIDSYYQQIVSDAPGAVFCCLIDQHWTMEYISPGILDLTGYSPDDFIQNQVRSFNSIIHPDDRDMLHHQTIQCIKDMRLLDASYRIFHKDGSIRWIAERSRPCSSGGTVKFRGLMLDVTPLKRALSLSDSVLEAVDDGILVVSRDARIIRCNRKFIEMWGVSQEILDDGNDWRLISLMQSQLSSSEVFWRHVNQDYECSDNRTHTLLCLHDGRVIERKSSPYLCEGEQLGQVMTYRDVTNRLSLLPTLINGSDDGSDPDFSRSITSLP